jgi:hypothetical protein
MFACSAGGHVGDQDVEPDRVELIAGDLAKALDHLMHRQLDAFHRLPFAENCLAEWIDQVIRLVVDVAIQMEIAGLEA